MPAMQQHQMMQQQSSFPPIPGAQGHMINPGQMMGGHPQQQLINPAAQADDDCRVCMNQKINTVMVPCGHRVCCEQCSKVVNKSCPICNAAVQQVIKTY